MHHTTLTARPTRSARSARTRGLFAALITSLWLTGCATRSISNATNAGATGPDTSFAAPRIAGTADPGFEYRGELNEFDVLGVDRSHAATEAEIAGALDGAKNATLRRGSRVLLVQSGAVFPDSPMVAALEEHVDIVPFSGIPPRQRTAADPEPAESFSYARNLRLVAARAGAESILCYWGTLESARRKLETKTVSWVPIAGWMVPDEAQHMRIRLKLALIDVRTGHWRVLTPKPFTDKAWSTKAYVAGARKVLSEFASTAGVP